VYSREVTVTPAGAAGAATASGTTTVPPAFLKGVRIDYTSQPVTTDVVLTNAGRTLLTVSNANTDRVVQPKIATHDNAGADQAAHVESPLVWGTITVTVNQGDPVASGVKVTLLLEN
jgi:hypothetical protein